MRMNPASAFGLALFLMPAAAFAQGKPLPPPSSPATPLVCSFRSLPSPFGTSSFAICRRSSVRATCS